MKRFRRIRMAMVAAAVLGCGSMANAAANEFNSHEVQADGRITFRYRDRRAEHLWLNLEGHAKPLAMVRGEHGVWTVTTPPLAPQIYAYSFEADGEPRLDPLNPVQKPNLIASYRGNLVTVPGPGPQPWEPADVPHGVVHRHVYPTKFVLGLPGNQSDFYVYTPPGYDPRHPRRYPVLYLLHGWSDLTAGWVEVGKAPEIMDALIARGLAEPMVVVMPRGYGDMDFVKSWAAWDDVPLRNRNYQRFEQALLGEVMPRVEAAYAVSPSRDGRAIAGLSMGGRESLTVGLNHPELFAWVGGFSSALEEIDYARDLPAAAPEPGQLRLLWVACGTDDDLLASHRRFIGWLQERKFPVTAVETPGGHIFPVWRENLIQFAPLLFRRAR